MRKYLLLISALVFLLDAFTKWLVKAHVPLFSSIDVVPGLFRITHLENTGAAFSLFADSTSPWAGRLLTLFSVAALVVISILLWRTANAINLTSLSLALFLGGTLGNLCDRLARGRVTDFLDVYFGSHHWPPFNVADSAIVIGAILIAWRALFAPAADKPKTE